MKKQEANRKQHHHPAPPNTALIRNRETATLKCPHAHSSALTCSGHRWRGPNVKGMLEKPENNKLQHSQAQSSSHWAETQSFYGITPTLPVNGAEKQQVFPPLVFTVPPSLVFLNQISLISTFSLAVRHIPAATQRGSGDSLISHTGQRRGQHTRTSASSFIPLPTDLLLMPLPELLANPISVFVRMSLRGFFRIQRIEGIEGREEVVESLSRSMDPGLEE